MGGFWAATWPVSIRVPPDEGAHLGQEIVRVGARALSTEIGVKLKYLGFYFFLVSFLPPPLSSPLSFPLSFP